MKGAVMIHNNEANHCCNANVEKVSHRKMVVLTKIFYNHRDKLEIEKKDKNLFKEMLKVG